jgi:hypothetical protein
MIRKGAVSLKLRLGLDFGARTQNLKRRDVRFASNSRTRADIPGPSFWSRSYHYWLRVTVP